MIPTYSFMHLPYYVFTLYPNKTFEEGSVEPSVIQTFVINSILGSLVPQFSGFILVFRYCSIGNVLLNGGCLEICLLNLYVQDFNFGDAWLILNLEADHS